MARRAIAALVQCACLATLAACERPQTPPPTPGASAPRAVVRDSATPATPRVAVLGAVTDSAGRPLTSPTVIMLFPEDSEPVPTAGHPTLGVACDSVGAMLSRRLHEPATRSDDTTLTAWKLRPGSRGCVMVWKGTFARTPEMNTEVWNAFISAGWVPANYIQADGPDGSTFGMVSRTTLCVSQGEWDGGDDGDSTYVPVDWWGLTVQCDDDLTPAQEVPDYVRPVRADTGSRGRSPS